MGFDKAIMSIGGMRCAERIAGALRAVVGHAVEVGPGVSGLAAVLEEHPGTGPLVAVCEGRRALLLGQVGEFRSALVVACDLPLVTEAVLRTLARWPGDRSVVPVVAGRSQPLCARWSSEDLTTASLLVGEGHRSMRSLLDNCVVELVDVATWPESVDHRAFADVDRPADIERLGLVVDPADRTS